MLIKLMNFIPLINHLIICAIKWIIQKELLSAFAYEIISTRWHNKIPFDLNWFCILSDDLNVTSCSWSNLSSFKIFWYLFKTDKVKLGKANCKKSKKWF